MKNTFLPSDTTVAGMGAVPLEQGVHFRVWAPNADAVFVSGSFNNFAKTSDPLESEGNGYWAGTAADAKTGDEYKYFLQTPYGEFFRNDPYAKQMTNSAGNGVIYDGNRFDWGETQYQMPSWNKLVIYELHTGTFNVKEEGKPGNLYGVIEKLPYLKELGINAIEVMPPFEFPGGFSWGYNPAQPFAIESEYGGPDAFKSLVKAAHEQGIAVILDVVYNHFGPGDLDLWQFDGWSENGKGGVYFYNDWKSETPWGDTRPDYGRGEVRQYLRDNALMWLEEYRVDGLRMDMIPYIRNVHADESPGSMLEDGLSLLRWINGEIAEKFPWKLTIAEDLHGLDSITNPAEGDGLGFGAQWDGDFVHPVRYAIIAPEDAERDMYAMEAALMRQYSGDPFHRIVYTESHDEVANGKARVAEEISDGDVNNWYSKKRASLGMAMVLTSPGIPMIFQGHELLEDRWFSDTDPIDWNREKEFNGFVRLHRDLIRLRLNKGGISEGLTGRNTEVIRVDNEKKMLVFQRWQEGGAGDTTVVVLNFSGQAYSDYRIGMPGAGLWKIRFNSDWEGYDQEFGDYTVLDTNAEEQECDGYPHSASISAGPYSAIILSQDK
ncbi:maltooligosyl trehalose hydrolase [Mucilaginibacter gossypiicola]|uniref:1,4-alpha-glucan branching enzyme n=1 Tax=Mucilaginibacter gossypiicola TaxID=551995 RepID=A0A1H8KTV5_9SPHI|nr:alpha-amylase family glycosyl hydrolase [Mucilaginibacter gossypiicola]SEN96350.1 maltooligosyl trehalose hydrolase [Mucilaginibacter gossypiicola]